jgi:hypothetical protein
MKRCLLLAPLVLLLAGLPARAGGDPSDGHTHGEEVGGGSSVTAAAVTTTAMTVRFEAVLKHAPVRGGQPYAGTLYLADFPTNAPVAGAALTLQGLGLPDGGAFTVEATEEPGVYAVARPQGFPADGTYDLALTVEAGGASDLLLLQRVYVGPVEAPEAPVADGSGGGGFPWVWLLVVLVLSGGLAAFLARSARQRRAGQGVTPAPPQATPPHPPTPSEPTRLARRDRPAAEPHT